MHGIATPIAVIGPTATGKSQLGVDLALRLGGEVVNIDSAAQYRGMDIGTAKPSEEERRGVAHHQIDVLDVVETATVARYQEAASADVAAILGRGRVPVVVGGSMMYVQALFDQWRIPATDPALRAELERELGDVGALALHRRLASLDPAAASAIKPSDERRVVRALEVVTLTGKPYAATMPQRGDAPRWGARMLGLDRDTQELDERIGLRTEAMFESGLVAETEGLVARGLRDGVTAPKLIGYAQVLAMLDGRMTEAEAVSDTTMRTRRHVRRQRSWFRRDPRVRWLDAGAGGLLDRALEALGAGSRLA
ncbi:tRNA (adenosine(37)-N6)-dimethylallyltransferase MiaA [Segniliparus rugosus]|uniref:tRNA dimethylallyltransferase n=1 Tax=Segniliparus rugosus (strain ATCC BAA-974 / DSM 45345 / CCUG 50838 / CIP 108380 / JCM 13579 / CDC 945) TaxID=679197 RepID=E5XMB7_SEGRC|nr:tRNA (adenosine(37)-N6)-dimethylallyltransferase MiaA [Segniliparus rugosus]EFV14496.1 tRNA dimethylallyltransferase [Segniliparus rugosus ATCC BAA-974]